tara:strand:+ start:28 stop:663 length:636 start_codon:yes stop_codon:yes gene_type:complete
MPDYQKSKIYKLVLDHTDQIYIGSTIQKLSQRLTKHVSDFRKGKNKCTSKKLFELGKVKIILIENCPCDSKEELHKRERHYIETMVCVNKYIPGRTDAEYYQDKKEHYQKKSKEYKLKNNDKIKEYKKEYRLKNNDKIKESKKEHYHKNIDKIKEKQKEYRLKNKERSKVRTICDCGLDVAKDHISRHKRTKKHMDIMESKTHLPIDAIHP